MQKECECTASSFTLSDKCLAGVQEDLAALHDHALNSQVLPDVLSLAHFIVHYSEDEETLYCHSQCTSEICQQFTNLLDLLAT